MQAGAYVAELRECLRDESESAKMMVSREGAKIAK
jgi:hypothetical protein